MTETIYLRQLKPQDVTRSYVAWLNDSTVNQYLEARHDAHTLDSVTQYVSTLSQPESDSVLLGIFDRDSNLHIGNVKIGPINIHHRHAELGIIIGNPKAWGKGIGSQAVQLATEYSATVLGLRTLRAGCYGSNLGSFHLFKKLGWSYIGAIPDYWIDNDGATQQEHLFCKDLAGYSSTQAKLKYLLIGSGYLLSQYAEYLALHSCNVSIVTAPRQKDSLNMNLVYKGLVSIYVSENINEPPSEIERILAEANVGICFGPPWIFSQRIIDLVGANFYNYNGIPIPDYIGGAHYSWQILNRSREGGCFLQRITPDIDRGEVLLSSKYILPDHIQTPAEYESENNKYGLQLLKNITYMLATRARFMSTPVEWSEKSYYPRLSTQKNGWINWSWNCDEIARFCCAFSDPYTGAQTTIRDLKISLTLVATYPNPDIHPFCAGIVVSRSLHHGTFKVAAHGGILEFSLHETSEIALSSLNVGDRLFTSSKILEISMSRASYDAFGLIDS